jgi:hypothetical protein
MTVKVTMSHVPIVVVDAEFLIESGKRLKQYPHEEVVVTDQFGNFVILKGNGCMAHELVVIDSKVTIQYAVEDGEVMTSYPEILDTGEGRRVYCETCGQDAPELTEDDGRIVYKETQ